MWCLPWTTLRRLLHFTLLFYFASQSRSPTKITSVLLRTVRTYGITVPYWANHRAPKFRREEVGPSRGKPSHFIRTSSVSSYILRWSTTRIRMGQPVVTATLLSRYYFHQQNLSSLMSTSPQNIKETPTYKHTHIQKEERDEANYSCSLLVGAEESVDSLTLQLGGSRRRLHCH
jgi:hypothetical protein